jgi:hypothetical protein
MCPDATASGQPENQRWNRGLPNPSRKAAMARMARMTAMYICVVDRATGVCGYAWRIGWRSTSFYIKPRYAPIGGAKVSLHGPDERHERPGFKLDIDQSALPKVIAAEGLIAGTEGWLPRWFAGRQVTPGARHVVRFRWSWDLFYPGVPSAPSPGTVRDTDFAAVVAPPPVTVALDVDLYVGDSKPFWPTEQQARKDNACLGPLRNDAGQYLTGVVSRRSVLLHRTPDLALSPTAVDPDDRVRGLGMTVDEDEVLWIREQWMSKAALIAGAAV